METERKFKKEEHENLKTPKLISHQKTRERIRELKNLETKSLLNKKKKKNNEKKHGYR